MKELNNQQHILYTQALKNPSLLSEDDLLQLIVRYPYSQPLIFAYERRKAQSGQSSENKSLALLYSTSSSWLWTFLNTDLSEEKEIVFEESPVTDVEATEIESFDDFQAENVVSVEEEIITDIEVSEKIAQANEERDELDVLVNQGSVLADYFVFDSKTEEEKIELSQTQNESQEPEAEKVSLYNDDLMPYSFRWWLHKTRLEHADTYQPFAVVNLKKSESSQVDFGKLDDAILDQQIKQHIIHFQDPEAKLSDEVKRRPVGEVQPKKTDTIIERFIREEPIIQAPSAENLNNENMARQSAEDNYVLVTETLANIYKDQGLFQKAIEVFNKLILKYPEKKSYFASRIQELEKNI